MDIARLEVAAATSHKEASAWDVSDAARFQAAHPGVATEQEAVAALARLRRSYGQLGDELAAGESRHNEIGRR